MNRRRIIMISITVLLLSGITFHYHSTRAPIHDGKTFTQWLEEYAATQQDRSDGIINKARSQKASQAIRSFGTNGIPTLLKLLAAKDSSGIQSFTALLTKWGMRSSDSPAKHKWMMAVEGFEVLGETAKSAAPALMRLASSGSQDQRYYALVALERIQPDKRVVVPFLTQLLSDTNVLIAAESAEALKMLYPHEAEKAKGFVSLADRTQFTNSVLTNTAIP
jgi:HEAT repeat protein